jgi:hypothetical protein
VNLRRSVLRDTRTRGLLSVVAVGAIASSFFGCGGNKDEDDGAAPKSAAPAATPAPTTAATPAPTTAVVPEGTTPPAGASRVKAELENRPDGLTGQPIAAGAAALHAPQGWVITKGPVTVAKPPTENARIAAVAFTGDPLAKINEAATAAGLTGCTWGPPEPLAAIGKEKLPGTAADGTCNRGGTKTAAAYVALPGQGAAVVGGWDDPAGDSASVFGSMRSLVKAAQGDNSGIKACCQALSQNAKSAPPQQQGAYIAAAAMCNSMAANPQGRQGLASIRALLAGAGAPAACK